MPEAPLLHTAGSLTCCTVVKRDRIRILDRKEMDGMKRKICFILLFCAVCLVSCTGSKKRSYLHALVTEEQTLLCGDYTQNGEPPTEEDIYYDLRGVDIDFSMDGYVFEKAEENEEGLLYYVGALSPEDPDFKVYQIGNFCGITCIRDFLAQAIKEAESGLRGQAVTYGVHVGYYNIDKMNIQEDDAESIEKVENYLQELFPRLDFSGYTRKMITGDAGQNSFLYYAKDEDSDRDAFSWTSHLQDTDITIGVRDREVLDDLLQIAHK